MKQIQLERMNKVNDLIKVIANTDRKFFNHENRENGEISHFIDGNKLFFLDGYTHKKIYPYGNSEWYEFCEGGTMRGLVQDFREWIITGKYSNGKNGYGGLYSASWGYSIDGMDKVISKAKEIGYIQEKEPSFRENCLRLKKEGNEWCLGFTVKQELGLSE